MNIHRFVAGLVLAGCLMASGASATSPPAPEKAASAAEHTWILSRELKWADAPPSLPKGAKVSVLYGDPNAAGPFAMRVRIPAGYKVPPHWHPADEHVTIISGEFYMALGETWDQAKGHALPAGAVSNMPTGVRHFAWAKVETVIQINAMGPWGITYVDPKDDPRNQEPATK